MPVFNGLQYWERAVQPMSPKLSILPTGESRMEMAFWCDWEDTVQSGGVAALASRAMLGYATVGTSYGGNVVKYIARTNPFQHPDHPNGMFLGDGFSSIEPDLPAGISGDGTALGDEAKISMSLKSSVGGYRILPDAVVVGDFPIGSVFAAFEAPQEFYCLRNMEIQEKATTKMQTIPAGTGLRWSDDNTPVSAAAFMLLYETEITIKWWPVPVAAYNEAALMALVGKTNDKPFPPSPAAAAVAAGLVPFIKQKLNRTLVMGTPSKEIIRMGDMNWAYRITLHMRYYPAGANYLFRHNPAAGSPRHVQVQRPDGSFLFEPADFATGFVPP